MQCSDARPDNQISMLYNRWKFHNHYCPAKSIQILNFLSLLCIGCSPLLVRRLSRKRILPPATFSRISPPPLIAQSPVPLVPPEPFWTPLEPRGTFRNLSEPLGKKGANDGSWQGKCISSARCQSAKKNWVFGPRCNFRNTLGNLEFFLQQNEIRIRFDNSASLSLWYKGSLHFRQIAQVKFTFENFVFHL